MPGQYDVDGLDSIHRIQSRLKGIVRGLENGEDIVGMRLQDQTGIVPYRSGDQGLDTFDPGEEFDDARSCTVILEMRIGFVPYFSTVILVRKALSSMKRKPPATRPTRNSRRPGCSILM
jgi:hypothetical protein